MGGRFFGRLFFRLGKAVLRMYRVILVDDEVLIREAVKNSIRWEELGYELAACCKNGMEARDFLEKEPVDLVVTDICMPYMDGMELSKYIYENHPSTKVLILSGYDDFQYAKQAIQYKVEEYLLKPVTAAELSSHLTALRETLDRQRKETTEYRQIKAQIQKNRLVIRSNALMHLMKFSMPEEDLLEELSANGIFLKKACYRVASVAIDLFENGQEGQKEREQSALMSFVVYNITEELVRKQGFGEVFQGAFAQTVILFESDAPEELQKSAPDLCRKIHTTVTEALHLPVTVGLGSVADSWKKIPASYRESQSALTCRYVLGDGQIIDIREIRQKNGSLPRLTDHIESLVMQIRLNRQAQIRETIEQIGGAIQSFFPDKEQVCLLLQQMMQNIHTRLEETEQLTDRFSEREEQLMRKLPEFSGFELLMAALDAYYSDLAVELEVQRNRSMRKPVVMALDYLNRHYDDPDLSLQTICQYLSISTSRFSAIFKDATGETFVEALTRIRMGHAKKLLAQTELKGYEVAEHVGYSDPHYFSICFKKATGMSPTEFAKERRGTQ